MTSRLARISKVAWVLAGLGLALTSLPVRAQESGRVRLYPPDTSQFPTFTLYLDARDASGGVLHDLQPSDVSLTEDGQFVPVGEMREVHPGMDIAVAVNAGPSMGVRNAQGEARFDVIAAGLDNWASQGGGEATDTYGLFTNGGKPVSGVAIADWQAAFSAYKADFRNAKPSLESLDAALATFEALPEKPGRNRALLWITTVPEGSLVTDLGGVSERLQKARLRLFIWSVSPTGAFNSEGANALRELADGSGGQYFPFSGVEVLPDINGYFEPLRGIYLITYSTAVRSTGDHNLSAQIQEADGTLASDPVQFQFDIQPPNPMLVSPPSQITRTSPADSRDPLQALTPVRQSLRALVEFPDNHSRTLTATRLYVDGQMVAENTHAPFDQFTWDLAGYTTSGIHRIKIEAVDELGLSAQSLELPVDVKVIIPPANLSTTLARNSQYVAWASVALGGLVLGLLIFLGYRRGLFGPRRSRLKTNPNDPLTQPVSPNRVTGRMEASEHTWLRRGGQKTIVAQLVWLDENGSPLEKDPFLVGTHDVIFGREPTQANCLIRDASVDATHARLSRNVDGRLILRDLGSVAGTWINYAPVSLDGAHLEHGDIIHIGRVSFRLALSGVENPPTPRIEKLSEIA